MLEVFPIKFEAFNEMGLAFTVEAFDEFAAVVTINNPVTVESFNDLCPAIIKCLTMIEKGI